METLKMIFKVSVVSVGLSIFFFVMFIGLLMISSGEDFNPNRYESHYEGAENYGEWNEGMTQKPWTIMDEYEEMGK